MKITSGSEKTVEILSIPFMKRTSLKFKILKVLAEEGDMLPGNISWRTQKKLSIIHSEMSRLRKMGLVKTRLDFRVKLTEAGEWYVKEYEILEKTIWKR